MSDDVIESIEIFNPENRVLFDVTVEIPKGTKNKYEMDASAWTGPCSPPPSTLTTTASSKAPSVWTATPSTRW